MLDFVVKDHAIQRWKERCEPSICNRKTIRERINQFLKNAIEVELKPEFRLMYLLRYNFQKVQYFKEGGIIFVVEEGRYVRTVHKGEVDRWVPINHSNK